MIMSENGKERKKMPTLQERLDEANKKVDVRIDDIWKQAELNLKQAEEEFYRRKEGKKRD
jgi:hypothetical protein